MEEREKEDTCPIHGKTKFMLVGSIWRCCKCHAEARAKSRHKIKNILVASKGGKCEICGFDKDPTILEFHHLDPSSKKFNISSPNNPSFDLLKEEAEKCILVCPNCHRELHAREFEEREKEKVKAKVENVKWFLANASEEEKKHYSVKHLKKFIEDNEQTKT